MPCHGEVKLGIVLRSLGDVQKCAVKSRCGGAKRCEAQQGIVLFNYAALRGGITEQCWVQFWRSAAGHSIAMVKHSWLLRRCGCVFCGKELRCLGEASHINALHRRSRESEVAVKQCRANLRPGRVLRGLVGPCLVTAMRGNAGCCQG